MHRDWALLSPGFPADFDAASSDVTLFNMFTSDGGYFILCLVILFHCA